MADSGTCPQCGSPLVVGHAVCARCTVRLVLASGADVDEELDAVGRGELARGDGSSSVCRLDRVGAYSLEAEIGRGAMGVVYRARDVRLGRLVALKLVLAGRFASMAERQRFVLEAEAAARLDHPHIVTVYESGEAEGRPFFSMRLVDGCTLADRLRDGSLEPAQAVRVARQVAEAVQHAHERGVLHRDLKPGNVLLDAAGEPHVADFGLARQADREAALTLAGSPLGTPAYMAPEAGDGSFSAASDVWSIGVMLYEMLSGRPPFGDTSLTGTLLAVREREPAPLRLVSGVDRDLESVCLRCLEKDPGRRYRSAADLAEDLARWERGLPVMARPVTRKERFVKWVRRNPGVAALVLTAGGLFVAGVSGVLWQWRRANREAGVATAALLKSEESLWRANADQARARIGSRSPGQRTESWTALRQASSHRPTSVLRDLAVAALALPDLAPGVEDVSPVELPLGATFRAADPSLKRVGWKSGDAFVVSDLTSGAEWARVVEPGLSELGVSVDADLGRVALVGPTGVTVRSLPEGTPVWSKAGVRTAALDATGRLIATLEAGGRLEVHEVVGGKPLGGRVAPAEANGLSLSPDGGRLAVWGGLRLSILRLPGLEATAEFEKLPSPVLGVAWHPYDESVLAGLDTTGLVHFDPVLKSGRVVARHDREGAFPLMHPGGLIAASTAWDGTTRLSALGWGELLVVHSLRPLAFSDDGSWLLVVRDRRLQRVAVTVPDVWRPLALGQLEARGMAFSADSRWLAVTYRGGLAVWDTAAGRLLARAPLGEGQVVGWRPDGSLWVSEQAEGLARFEFRDGPPAALTGPERLLDGSHGSISSFVDLKDGRIATNGQRLLVWRWPGWSLERELESNPFSDLLRGSPDGKWIGAGCWANTGRPGSFVGIWSPDHPSPVHRLPSGNADLSFSPDGRTCLVGEISTYRLYDTETWRAGRGWERPSSGLDAARAAWSADSRKLVLHADETSLRLMEAESGEEWVRLATPISRRIERFEFSPDGRWLAGISTGALHLWDLGKLKERLAEIRLAWPE